MEYDYVIIGAGPSAIGLLFGLLEPFKHTQVPPPFTIAVVERGNDNHDRTTRSPRNWYEAAHSSNSTSVTQISTTISGRLMYLPTGRGVGGTSNINACICTPSLEMDLKSWPKPWKDTLLPNTRHILSVIEENESIYNKGFDASGNLISSLETSSRVPTLATKENIEFLRKNYYDGLLEPLLKDNPKLSQHVSWILDTEVQRIIIDKEKVAKGVMCSSRYNTLFTITALKEVILCAGAIETPALMMTSEVQLDGIGKHLKDQVAIPLMYLGRPNKGHDLDSANGISGIGSLRSEKNHFQLLFVDSQFFASTAPSALAMCCRRGNRIFHRILYSIWKGIFAFLLRYSPLGFLVQHFGTNILLYLMHPVSEGSIKIKANTQSLEDDLLLRRNVDLHVRVGYLTDKRDLETMRQGLKACSKLTYRLEAVPSLVLQPLSFFFAGTTTNWFQFYCNNFSQPYYHFCCSCIMRTNDKKDDWVVDYDLKVREHSRLRICDASVFPSTISSPPSLSCAALGYGLGLRIAEQYLK